MVRRAVADGLQVLNLDKLTYAAGPGSLASVEGAANYRFVQGDVCDAAVVRNVIASFRPDTVLHLAAESHVDRSIDGPDAFVQTNIVGTFVMLAEARRYWTSLAAAASGAFRFVHVSTDEVFGSLGAEGLFTPDSPYAPSSPYSASKAASDHLSRAWCTTYGLPVIVTNCSNNYGPDQFPEQLIPLAIGRVMSGEPIPVYGDGMNVRDWLYVEDHVEGLLAAARHGRPGGTYLFGGRAERTNLDVVRSICAVFDEMDPQHAPHERIQFVVDRPVHDRRDAIDPSVAESELGWKARESFESGMRRTVQWYADNQAWVLGVQAGRYSGERLGMIAAR